VNVLFVAGLIVATGARALVHPQALAADVCSHSRGVGFFTMAAAAAVFGTELDLQIGDIGLAMVFLATAAVLWLVMTYGVLAVLMVQRDKPALAQGLNGGWLVIVVAPQSVAILIVLLLAHGAPTMPSTGVVSSRSGCTRCPP
jgi:hypothetical protein